MPMTDHPITPPQSPKERALLALSQIEDQHLPADLAAEIRRALEELPE